MSLIIRRQQMEVLERHAMQQFEARMVSHIKTSWREEYDKLGAEAVLASIRRGISTSAKYGIKTEYDVARYLNVMYALGHDFDKANDQFLWAAEILTDPDLRGDIKMDKISHLTEEVLGTRANAESSE